MKGECHAVPQTASAPRVRPVLPDPAGLAGRGAGAGSGWGKVAGQRGRCALFGDVIASQGAVKFNTGRICLAPLLPGEAAGGSQRRAPAVATDPLAPTRFAKWVCVLV